ncbi:MULTISPECIES: hypothetical protein [unclassified Methanoregula]|uniref:hypothetical protein n=1 Tax=unclassified Methanoregula TaxID=2649730 RepID=UPI0025D8D907|nr:MULTISPECIES: hypothetical protein [unclassified Methanoregula]
MFDALGGSADAPPRRVGIPRIVMVTYNLLRDYPKFVPSPFWGSGAERDVVTSDLRNNVPSNPGFKISIATMIAIENVIRIDRNLI